MPTKTTDFEEFITAQHLGDDDFEEVWDLYETVDGGDGGFFSAEDASNGARIIKANGTGNVLVLPSDKAREAFKRFLGETFADDFGGDIEAWAGYKRAVSNPKA